MKAFVSAWWRVIDKSLSWVRLPMLTMILLLPILAMPLAVTRALSPEFNLLAHTRDIEFELAGALEFSSLGVSEFGFSSRCDVISSDGFENVDSGLFVTSESKITITRILIPKYTRVWLNAQKGGLRIIAKNAPDPISVSFRNSEGMEDDAGRPIRNSALHANFQLDASTECEFSVSGLAGGTELTAFAAIASASFENVAYVDGMGQFRLGAIDQGRLWLEGRGAVEPAIGPTDILTLGKIKNGILREVVHTGEKFSLFIQGEASSIQKTTGRKKENLKPTYLRLLSERPVFGILGLALSLFVSLEFTQLVRNRG